MADTQNAVAWACRHVVDVLHQWCVPSDLIETAKLVVTEPATNAIRLPGEDCAAGLCSASSAVGTITTSLSLASSTLVVSVCEPILQTDNDVAIGNGVLLAAGAPTAQRRPRRLSGSSCRFTHQPARPPAPEPNRC
ncbi:hypothetical protein ACWGR4_13430 [Embleya sp. NPDC055664]